MGAELSILLGGQTELRLKEEKQQKQKKKFKKDGVGVGSGHVVAKEVKAKEEEEEGRQGEDRAKGAGGARDGRNRRANIMHHSPFRGLRRAASSSASSINCCSSVPCATSTTGHTYPYPRTHSTLMVIPSAVRPPIVSTGAGTIGSRDWASSVNTSGTTRPQSLLDSMDEQNNNNEQLVLHFPYHPNGGQPLLSNNNNNEGEPWSTDGGVHVQQQQQRQSLVSQYGFQTHRPRPPLNRAIPPIPESRSNESIQSGLVARQQSVGSVAAIQQQIAQIIDENNPIDAEMTPADGAKLPDHLATAERSGVENERTEREAPSKTAATPKSPLMSVAHSVKTRLSRLTALKQAKDALPMSRSLEIGRQQSRIPTVCGGDPMTKSWSLETTTTTNLNNSEMPRRGPMTTLLPSPRGVPRRLPPGEETDDHSTSKQVQFAPLPVLSSTTELRRVPEMEFSELTFEEREKERPRGNRTKMTAIEAMATRSNVPPPLPKSSPPQLLPSLSTPKTLRKSPQSFPPMGAHSAPISFADDVPPPRVRAAKSVLSVSFGAVEGGGPIRDRKAQKNGTPEERGGKRRVFCSRSLRLVATRVCEASPLLVRRRRGRSAGRDGTGDRETAKTTKPTDQQKEASSSSSYTGLFRKRHSVPAEQKVKSKSFSESASITSAGAATTGVRLRSVRSVTDSRAQKVNAAGVLQHRRVAPLAESESSRVADENSPAVEQCGAVPWKMGIKMGERRGFFGGKIKSGRANAGSAISTTAPKEGQKSQ
uniref:SH2 domain-containing protein n=1 Tax=Globodera pallida TaxID=36090 RepID=A0A183CLX9_GLOPA